MPIFSTFNFTNFFFFFFFFFCSPFVMRQFGKDAEIDGVQSSLHP